MLLENKITIITGASGGIGLGIAKKFLEEGAIVSVFDVKECHLNPDNRFNYFKVDVTNKKEVDNAVSKLIKRYKKIDILINNAGIIDPNPFLRISEKNWDKVFDVNCKSVYICSRSVIYHMIKNNYGSIINIASIGGVLVRINLASYCASKAAVIHLTKCLAIEFSPYNIRINCVCPGMTYTKLMKKVFEKNSTDKNKIEENIPLKKFATVEDHAELVTFLASDRASHITGQTISVDGGQTISYKY